MKKNSITKTVMGILVTAFVFAGAAVPSAAFASENVPVTVGIPITYIVHGNDEKAGGDTFVLTADDPEAPMPEGSEQGRLTLDISREGTYSFGEISYDRPEVWWYTVSRETSGKKGVSKDDAVFRVKVIALNDGHGYVLVYRDGSEKKVELVYEDRVAPETGDASMLICWGAGFAASGSILVLVLRAYIKKRRQAKEDAEMFA